MKEYSALWTGFGYSCPPSTSGEISPPATLSFTVVFKLCIFKPYAGVSTAVLIFTKGGKTENIWFYNMGADGYSLDDKRTPIDRKGDIPDVIERFRKRKEENPIDRKGKCFYVPAD